MLPSLSLHGVRDVGFLMGCIIRKQASILNFHIQLAVSASGLEQRMNIYTLTEAFAHFVMQKAHLLTPPLPMYQTSKCTSLVSHEIFWKPSSQLRSPRTADKACPAESRTRHTHHLLLNHLEMQNTLWQASSPYLDRFKSILCFLIACQSSSNCHSTKFRLKNVSMLHSLFWKWKSGGFELKNGAM